MPTAEIGASRCGQDFSEDYGGEKAPSWSPRETRQGARVEMTSGLDVNRSRPMGGVLKYKRETIYQYAFRIKYDYKETYLNI